ncbi:heme-thiolate peroxidase [Crepidotus variabilis]|uniref:Heme-thiolate peroxidase n=1 Tax=Crepidotus variabilis TaxID=179855 RepID=A0A9P6JMJ9_9AGAR|nr:heme-thiolate peroxidase [Crepidotus variabilis]
MKSFAALSAILALAFTTNYQVSAFPAYASLAGLSEPELAAIIPTLHRREPQPLPLPQNDTSTKLVNDAAHPWMPLRQGDIRGPCPGLNTLASHGYLPRNGVASPNQIINAVQEGFNMEYNTAVFVTYAAHLVDGNLITDRLSIGGKTPLTGPDPAAPASVAGLSTHQVFEGDSSITRADAFFGNNHSFNETLFQQFVDFSNRFGGGKYNLTVAGELRYQRIQESIATNPNFTFISPRFFTAYAESTFPVNFFVDGRKNGTEEAGQLDMDAARSFFETSKFPEDFFRPAGPTGPKGINEVFKAHPVQPGKNMGTVNSYTVDPTSADLTKFCLLYENFVNQTIARLYPSPKGALRQALNVALEHMYKGMADPECTQLFPYGQD